MSSSKAKLPPAQAITANTAVLVIRSPIEVHASVEGVGEGTVPAGGELRFEVSITYSPKRRLTLTAPGRPPLTTIVELERGQSLTLQAHTIDAKP